MNVPTLHMQPNEKRIVTFDFASKLAAGDSLKTSAPAPRITISPSGALAVLAGPTIAGTEVRVRFGNGVHAIDYDVQCEADTTNGDTLSLDVVMAVREKVN